MQNLWSVVVLKHTFVLKSSKSITHDSITQRSDSIRLNDLHVLLCIETKKKSHCYDKFFCRKNNFQHSFVCVYRFLLFSLQIIESKKFICLFFVIAILICFECFPFLFFFLLFRISLYRIGIFGWQLIFFSAAFLAQVNFKYTQDDG